MGDTREVEGRKAQETTVPARGAGFGGAYFEGEDIRERPVAPLRMGHPPGFTLQARSASESSASVPELELVPK